MADFERAHLLAKQGHEPVMYAGGYDKPAGCRAALPAAEEGAVQRHRHGTIQVRVVQHHERILPPHLQLKTGGRGGRVNGQFAPDASGPGEGESLDTRITDQLGGHRTWYRSEEHTSELQSLMRIS